MSKNSNPQFPQFVQTPVDFKTFQPPAQELFPLQKKIVMGTQTGEEKELFVNNDMSLANINRPQ